MSSNRDPRDALIDIPENIRRVEAYLADTSKPAFAADGRSRDVVERCLERISEAAIRLGEVAASLMPQQPWPDIRGMGNWLRHAYDRVNLDIIWATVECDLPGLKADIERALAALPPAKE